MKRLIFASCLLALPTTAAVIADNLSAGPFQNGTPIGNSVMQAFGLDIGSATLLFTSLETIFDNNSPQTSRVVSGGIYSDNGGNPNALLMAFNLITMTAQSLDATLSSTTASSFDLLPNTRYWFVLAGPLATGLNWQTDLANTAPAGSVFASTVGYRSTSNSGASWSASTINTQLRINADVVDFGLNAVPEPSTFGLAATALLAAGLYRRRR